MHKSLAVLLSAIVLMQAVASTATAREHKLAQRLMAQRLQGKYRQFQGAQQGPGKLGASGDMLTVDVNGTAREYLLYVPSSCNTKESAALMLCFHGGGGDARTQDRMSAMNATADRAGFIVCYPQGIAKRWNDGRKVTQEYSGDDMAFIGSLIAKLETQYNIDNRRIYACGISNGGFFSSKLALEMPDIFAATAFVASSLAEVMIDKHPGAGQPIPVMFLAGTKDPLVPYDGGDVSLPFGPMKGKSRGKVLSIPDAVKFWVTRNHCDPTPSVFQIPDNDPQDGCRVKKLTYTDPRLHNDVVLYDIEGGGHTWPSGWQYFPAKMVGTVCRDFNGSDAIWEFCANHQKAAAGSRVSTLNP